LTTHTCGHWTTVADQSKTTPTALSKPEAACRLLGHRYVFTAEGVVMTWRCARCAEGGAKQYSDPASAARFAAGLNADSAGGLGRRAPLIGLFPLRVWHHWRNRRR
jgi:hypothetical protein